jgi:hypothetical protein
MIDDASLRERLAGGTLATIVRFDWNDSTNRLISIIEKHLSRCNRRRDLGSSEYA